MSTEILHTFMIVQKLKQRFGIIGNYDGLNRAIEIAVQVAHTDLSVLITGESGTGKEVFPQIIHQNSTRKHGAYIAVNCGAIPEGTIDSELFGHEKGSFTGATETRKGYFEVADNGTIFLDEVSELPLATQVRLLRVLETGEFMKVGSSKSQKTNVRVVAASNLSIDKQIAKGKFREDLYYRLNTVPILIPPLRMRGEDIVLLFRKFATDFAERYRMPPIRLTNEAKELFLSYQYPGNIRQLKNITEQLSVIEENRDISGEIAKAYLPQMYSEKLPAIIDKEEDSKSFASEREILYKILFDLKKDMTELRKMVLEVMNNENINAEIIHHDNSNIINRETPATIDKNFQSTPPFRSTERIETSDIEDTEEIIEESLLLEQKELEMIQKALEKHNGKRKNAAEELGISERTLYRKIKEYNLG